MSISRLPVFCALVASLCSGCAFFDDGHEDHWRRLRVLEVTRRSDLPPNIDDTCLERSFAQNSDLIAVVRYRVGRTFYRHAFVLPPNSRTTVGETIEVNPRLCELRLDDKKVDGR